MKPNAITLFERGIIVSLITFFSVINLSSSTGMQLLVAAALIAAMWFVILVNSRSLVPFYMRLLGFKANAMHYINIFLLSLICIAYLRGAAYGTISLLKASQMSFIWFSVFLFAITVFSKYKTTASKSIFVHLTLLSIVAYVFLNAVLFLLGMEPLNTAYQNLPTGKATILALFGVSMDRVVFPLALGVNGLGIIAGAAVLIVSFLFKAMPRKRKPLYAILFLGACFALLATDSRGAIFFTCIVWAVVAFLPIKWLRSLRFAVLFIPFLPFLIIQLSTLIGGLLSALNLSRGDTVLSFRELIWANVLDFLQTQDVLNYLWGYGYLGQVTSGAYKVYYAFLFSHLNVEHPERASVHNFMLQNILDFGAIGVILILFSFFLLMTFLPNALQSLALYKASIAFLLYLLLAGTTDLTLNVYNFHLFMPFLTLTVFAAFEQPSGLWLELKQKAVRPQRASLIRKENY